MGIILDVIIVAIIALNVYLCYRKGLVNLAVGLIAVVAAIILSVIFYKPITNLIVENTEFDEMIENTIVETFAPEGVNEGQVKYVGILSMLETEIGNAVNETKNEVVYETAGAMATKIINLIVFIGIFTAVRVALFALTFVADAITSLPILKQLDDVGGILYGLVKALLIIYVVLAIVSVVVSFTASTSISDIIDSSYVTKFFYNHNILLNILL
ncbi:MAG: CvpA family protein [Clostridia bacterium]|nr:CvpA family protein [Clostridia bacterium]